MKKRIVKITGLTAAVIVISLILTLFVSAQSTGTLNVPTPIQNVTGYEIVFKPDLRNPDNTSTVYFEWQVFFECNDIKYQKMSWLNAGTLMYGIYDHSVEGLYVWTTVFNNGSWVNDNYRTIYFYGGDDVENVLLLNFINSNNAYAKPHIKPIPDPYEDPYNYIENNIGAVTQLKDNFIAHKNDYNLGVQALAVLLLPARQFYVAFGYAIGIGIIMVSLFALVKRTSKVFKGK